MRDSQAMYQVPLVLLSRPSSRLHPEHCNIQKHFTFMQVLCEDLDAENEVEDDLTEFEVRVSLGFPNLMMPAIHAIGHL